MWEIKYRTTYWKYIWKQWNKLKYIIENIPVSKSLILHIFTFKASVSILQNEYLKEITKIIDSHGTVRERTYKEQPFRKITILVVQIISPYKILRA